MVKYAPSYIPKPEIPCQIPIDIYTRSRATIDRSYIKEDFSRMSSSPWVEGIKYSPDTEKIAHREDIKTHKTDTKEKDDRKENFTIHEKWIG